MKNTFDFHFHLLFKHYMTEGFDHKGNVTTSGIAKILNEVMGERLTANHRLNKYQKAACL